jgi:N-acetylmuramoyl-L-alanine amidase
MFLQRLLKPEFTPVIPVRAAIDTQEAIDILARTIWGEARGELLSGQEAVTNVILNRVKFARQRGRFWWGNDIVAVCRKAYQFSCWNHDDPNFIKMTQIDINDRMFAQCLRLARRAVNNVITDNTGGATHYHTDDIVPAWARGRSPTAIIGNHIFYRITE